jgi:hypothetical protein
MPNKFDGVLMVAGLAYSLAALVAATAGLAEYVGLFFGGFLAFVVTVLRVPFALPILAFMGAFNVWEWHWFAALIFAAPGIVFFVLVLAGHSVGEILGRIHTSEMDPNNPHQNQ